MLAKSAAPPKRAPNPTAAVWYAAPALLVDVAASLALEAALETLELTELPRLLWAAEMLLWRLASDDEPAASVAVIDVLAAEAADERDEPRDEASEEMEDATLDPPDAMDEAREAALEVADERAPPAPEVALEPAPPTTEVAVEMAPPISEVIVSMTPWPETAVARARTARVLNCILTVCEGGLLGSSEGL